MSEKKREVIIALIFSGAMFGLVLPNSKIGVKIPYLEINPPTSRATHRDVLAISSHKDKGQGVVMMANSENGDNLMREVINSIAKAYGWSNFTPREREMYTLSEDTYRKYSGKYETGSNIQLDIRFENGLLKVYMNGELQTTLYPESEKKFFILEDRHAYTFVTNDKGEVAGVTIAGIAPTLITAKRIL